MSSIVIPELSVEAAEYFKSIAGVSQGAVNLSQLSAADVEQLLVVLEAELEHTPEAAVGKRLAVSNLAAALLKATK